MGHQQRQGERLMKPPPLPKRTMILGGAVLAGCIFIGLMTLLFGDQMIGVVLLDSQTDFFPYPLTIRTRCS